MRTRIFFFKFLFVEIWIACKIYRLGDFERETAIWKWSLKFQWPTRAFCRYLLIWMLLFLLLLMTEIVAVLCTFIIIIIYTIFFVVITIMPICICARRGGSSICSCWQQCITLYNYYYSLFYIYILLFLLLFLNLLSNVTNVIISCCCHLCIWYNFNFCIYYYLFSLRCDSDASEAGIHCWIVHNSIYIFVYNLFQRRQIMLIACECTLS